MGLPVWSLTNAMAWSGMAASRSMVLTVLAPRRPASQAVRTAVKPCSTTASLARFVSPYTDSGWAGSVST